jgi:hypothetical protein
VFCPQTLGAFFTEFIKPRKHFMCCFKDAIMNKWLIIFIAIALACMFLGVAQWKVKAIYTINGIGEIHD